MRRTAKSFRLDARELDNLPPLLAFVGDEPAEVGRRAGKRRCGQIGQSCLDLGIGEARIDLVVQLVDDLGGRVLGGAEAGPETRLIAWQDVAQSWNVGQDLRSRLGRQRERAERAGADVLDRGRNAGEVELDLPADKIGERRTLAAIRHMDDVEAGHHLEELASDMRSRPDAGRCHADLARIALGIGDELRRGFGRNRWIDLHDEGRPYHGRDRRDVADEIEVKFLIERRIDRGRRRSEQQRITIRRRTHDRFGADVGARTGPVLDQELLAQPLRQPLPHKPRDQISVSGGRERNDHAHRARWIGLRPSDARNARQRDSARGQAQKIAAGKFHCRSLHGMQSGYGRRCGLAYSAFLRTRRGNVAYWHIAETAPQSIDGRYRERSGPGADVALSAATDPTATSLDRIGMAATIPRWSINPKRSQYAVKDGAVGLRARCSRHQPKLSVFSRCTWLPYQLAGCNGLAVGREGRRADNAWPVPG